MQRLISLCLLTVFVGVPAGVRADSEVSFNFDIRPLLSEHCYECHGPDEGQRKADLRLDTRDGLFKDLAVYRIVAPGEPQESELYNRVTADDPETRMPPPDSGKSLSEEQMALVRKWIAQGAEWKGHWAYQQPTRPEPPPVPADAADVRNEIDRFVLARLREQGLQPVGRADRRTLIRRLSFDLTGLPPTPRQVDRFLNDDSPDAYEDLVDRLLASPHYGERMALWWLDLVRYADTNGFHGDNYRPVWMYRDYVIRAFNENKPFDEFTVEQLAGDLLPGATRETRIASGYNRLLMTTREGGAQPKEYRAKYAAQRVRNASTVWMGATLGCAQCHDHKFDPYTMRDFYSFASFFADVQETAVGKQQPKPMPTLEQEARVAELEEQMQPLRETLNTHTPELAAAQKNWEASLGERSVDWSVLSISDVRSQNGATLEVRDDGSILASGDNPPKDVYMVTASTGLQGVTAFRLEVLPDDSLPQKGPGRAGNGNFVLNELEIHVNGEPVQFANVTASHSQKNYPVKQAVDGKPNTGWAILKQTGRANEAVFETQADLGDAAGETTVTVRMHHNYGGSHTIGRFRLSATTASRPVRARGADGLPKEIREILAVDRSERTRDQKRKLAAHYRSIAPQLAPVRKKLAGLKKQLESVRAQMPKTLVATSIDPRTTRILPRGNWMDDSGPVVSPDVPNFLDELETDGRANRLVLARWFVSRENPLTARVIVNRLWKLLYGRGIVKTLDDFGSQGALPTHPRLLDWLAVEFMESGWDVKHMVKLMALSAAYRRSSQAGAELRKADPYNKWLARQGRFRLPAEMVRDNALKVSGLLTDRLGGPSVKPYQPGGYWSHLNFPKRTYQHDKGPAQYRRGLYTYWCRTFLHPSLLAFDAPTREECTVERAESNTPLQALVLLNDPTYVEASRAFAERIIREGGDGIEDRLHFAFRQALSRKPRPQELKLLSSLYRKHLEDYRNDPQAAGKFLGVGQQPVPEDFDLPELAAWTSVARTIFNLHETIMRY